MGKTSAPIIVALLCSLLYVVRVFSQGTTTTLTTSVTALAAYKEGIVTIQAGAVRLSQTLLLVR